MLWMYAAMDEIFLRVSLVFGMLACCCYQLIPLLLLATTPPANVAE